MQVCFLESDPECYSFVMARAEFSEAMNKCESLNYTLAVLETKEELNLITQTALKKGFT